MKKLKVYLDTTIFNFVFADDAPVERDLTRKFFSQINHFEVFISDIVIEEIAECPVPKRQKMMDLIEKYNIQELSLDEASRQLAIKYIKEGIIPMKYQDDALHIAIASVNEMDVLLSWNFQHIVKLKTKRESVGEHVNGVWINRDLYAKRGGRRCLEYQKHLKRLIRSRRSSLGQEKSLIKILLRRLDDPLMLLNRNMLYESQFNIKGG